EIFEAALHRDDLGGRFRTNVTVGVQTQLADAGPVDAADARNERQPLGEPGALGLDVHHVTAAENFAAEIGYRPHQRDVAAAEKRDAVTHALHPLQQMRG